MIDLYSQIVHDILEAHFHNRLVEMGLTWKNNNYNLEVEHKMNAVIAIWVTNSNLTVFRLVSDHRHDNQTRFRFNISDQQFETKLVETFKFLLDQLEVDPIFGRIKAGLLLRWP